MLPQQWRLRYLHRVQLRYLHWNGWQLADVVSSGGFGDACSADGHELTRKSSSESDAPQCGTMTVFAYPAASNSWINQFCANSWSENTVYRILPATTSSSSSLPPTARKFRMPFTLQPSKYLLTVQSQLNRALRPPVQSPPPPLGLLQPACQ